MNGMELTELVQALTEIASLLEQLGLPGIIALVLVGPLVVVAIVLVIDHLRMRRIESLIESYRADTQGMVEGHRADTQSILREYGQNHMAALQFYKDNVELVKQSNSIARGLQDVVVTNTRVMERVVGMAENNMHCPMVREQALGRR